MFEKFISWFWNAPADESTTQTPAVPQVEVAAPPAPEPAPPEPPAKPVSVLHAMLLAVEEHEAGHPLLLRTTQWFDELIQKRGDALLVSVEHAVLTALAIKYPLLAPLILAAKASQQAAANAPAHSIPDGVP